MFQSLGGSSESAAVFMQSNVGKSQKFQILYRNEEVDVEDIFVFRIHTLVDSTKVKDCYWLLESLLLSSSSI